MHMFNAQHGYQNVDLGKEYFWSNPQTLATLRRLKSPDIDRVLNILDDPFDRKAKKDVHPDRSITIRPPLETYTLDLLAAMRRRVNEPSVTR